MAWPAALGLMLGLVVLAMLLGLPVAFAFFLTNIVGAVIFLGGENGIMSFVRGSMASIANFNLAPVPLFLVMGDILLRSGMAFRAIDAIDRLILAVPGRLSVVAVSGGTIFSALSGSTIATTAMLGQSLLPEMLRRGYHPSMAMGPIMAIGGVDMLIPPSALTVLLGSLAGISISQLLIAGIIPGFLLSCLFVGWIVLRTTLDPSLAPAFAHESLPLWQRVRPLLLYVAPLVMIFVIVVAAMTAGWATPTEAAAIGAVATVAVAWIYRALTWSNLMQALMGTAGISGIILLIIVGATTFAQILTFSGATNGLVEAIKGAELAPWLVLAAMLLILLVLGCFVDQVSMMLICLPFFMPLVASYGFDPLWFGVLFLMCMQLGLLTPPFGMLLFTMKSVAPREISMSQVWHAVTPYVVMGVLALAAVIAWSPLATWLPKVLFK